MTTNPTTAAAAAATGTTTGSDTSSILPQEALAHFSTMIASYEHRVGHACREVASHLPSLLLKYRSATTLPTGLTILDNACGTGAATEELVKAFPTARVSAVDVIPAMVDACRAIVAASPALSAQVQDLRVEDGQTLASFADDTFDLSVTNFGIFFFPDPVAGARQIYRTLKPGGTAVVTVWKSLGFQPILWEVQDRIRPADPLETLVLNEPWYNPAKLETTLQQGGFVAGAVDFSLVRTAIWGRDRADFETVLVENMGAMVSRNWTDAEKARLAPVTASVIDEMQDRFCLVDAAGRLGCTMEAWVAICTKS